MDNNARNTVRRSELEQYITGQAMRNICALMNGELSFNVFARNIEWINNQHRAALRYSRVNVRGRLLFTIQDYFDFLQMMNDNLINELLEQQARQHQQPNAHNMEIPLEMPMNENAVAANNNNAPPEPDATIEWPLQCIGGHKGYLPG